jgi:oxalate decarboxylase
MFMHLFHFSQLPPQDRCESGYRIKATKSNFPILKGMSLYKVVLAPLSFRELHWHANVDELGYCISGRVLVSFYANENHTEKFLISKGEAFFIPSGALHSLENIGEENAELILQFSNEEPEDFALSTTFGMFSNAVLSNTWGVPAQHFSSIQRPIKEAFISKLKASSKIHQEEGYKSKYQFNLELSSALISNEGGSAKLARQNVWPILQKQALYSLILTNKGIREPHWHPETAELGYVHSGKERMSILSPLKKYYENISKTYLSNNVSRTAHLTICVPESRR